ncbi:hypothetical protein BDV18DRAFT_143284, partial [Aspergillus unguis]
MMRCYQSSPEAKLSLVQGINTAESFTVWAGQRWGIFQPQLRKALRAQILNRIRRSPPTPYGVLSSLFLTLHVMTPISRSSAGLILLWLAPPATFRAYALFLGAHNLMVFD